MATKQQTHAAALLKREKFLAEERELGRKAIEAARHQREAEARKAWQKGHEKHFKFVDECPHCSEIKRKQKKDARRESIEKVVHASKTTETPSLQPVFSSKAGV